jgi:hypothetical protein
MQNKQHKWQVAGCLETSSDCHSGMSWIVPVCDTDDYATLMAVSTSCYRSLGVTKESKVRGVDNDIS